MSLHVRVSEVRVCVWGSWLTVFRIQFEGFFRYFELMWKRECECVDNRIWVYLAYLFGFDVYGPIFYGYNSFEPSSTLSIFYLMMYCEIRAFSARVSASYIFLYGGAIQEGIFKGSLEMYFPFHSTYVLCWVLKALNHTLWSKLKRVVCACVGVHVCVYVHEGVIPPTPMRERFGQWLIF